MANNDVEKALNCVRLAEKKIKKSLDQSGLTQSIRNFLDDSMTVLQDLDTFLFEEDLTQSLNVLKEKSKALSEINARAKKEIKGLEKISTVIDDAAKAVDIVVKGFDLIGKAGLV